MVKGGWVGLYGRPGVVGKRTVHWQAEFSMRLTAGDHKGPHHLHTTALAPTESWRGAYRLMLIGVPDAATPCYPMCDIPLLSS